MAAAPELPLVLSISFARESSTISMTLFNQPEETKPALPLELKFKYDPSTPYAPIHEIVEDRNQRIKQHYWDLWQLDSGKSQNLEQLNIADEFEGELVTISEEEIEAFCRVVGNESAAYKKNYKAGMEVPMDFAIKLGWKAIMKPIFPNSIDGDLLKLVHLSNGFRVLPGAPALKPGDVVTSTSRIESVSNSDTGKTVAVRGTVYLVSSAADKGKEAATERVPVLEVTSSFFYRGKFTDYAQTFSRSAAPTYSVPIKTPEALAVLQSKEWFQWDDDAKPLSVGTTLQFKVESNTVYADKSSFASVEVSGGAYVITPELKLAVKVATIEYTSEGEGVTKGDPVIEYLKRHGTALEQPVLFEGGGYSLTKAGQCTFTTPASNLDYSLTSGDTNPIHTNPYFASLASLPGTITHGMHSSARTRKYVEQVVADNVGARVRKYEVGFTAMCLPSRKMEVRLKHAGMTTSGDRLIKIETVDVEAGNVVLSGTAEVAQAPTAYVFTGQGSQEKGMGMELYESSPVARAVWDEADRHLGEVYGFSILEIVRTNPKEKTVHFGGLKGQATRQKYMDMTYTTTDQDGNVKTLPLFGDIDLRTSRYTFSSPTGLLFATQFAQIALVVTEKAAFEDMRAKGLVQLNCVFAGHSLGEYSALASIADILPISALVDVVFYRGITMQRAVERDHLNRSSYGMVAVNPSRIGKTFGDAALREVVETIARRGNILIEVVNYNVEGQQYVVAGHLVALQSLTNVLNFLKIQKIDLAKLTETMSIEQVKEHLCEIVDECVQKARELQEKTGFITLERGFATIPLPGIDVPFHSRYLWAGVMPFRTYLSKKVNPAHFNADLLVGRYIPNLTAVHYEVTKEYAERIHTQTSSPRLEKILKAWDEENWGAAENRNKLGYAILIELLAYQFASPVRWIETQDILFKDFKFERLIELGPSPTLTGMATRTQKLKYDGHDSSLGIKRSIYCIAKHQKEIYYQLDDVSGGEEAPAPAAAAPAAPAPKAAPAPVAAAPPPPPPSAGPAAAVADEPLKAVDTLRIIIAQKLKKPVAEVPLTKTIKDLVGGKSTLQNEILGDLQGEFASAPEKGEEMPLAELGAALQQGYSGKLGKYTTGLVSRMIGAKMPGGFGLSAVQGHLGKTYGLGAGRIDGVLLFALIQEPAKRLGNEAEAKGWVDSVAQGYASFAGISLSAAGGGAPAAPAMSFAAPAAGGGGAPAAVADEPLKATDTLRAIIAQKLKKQISDVPLGKSIKDLVGGKSTLQNEILGDLQGEFSSAPEKGEELPLSELGAALNQGYSGSLGKYTSGLVARMIGAKMPGGFGLSAVKGHLASAHGLGPGRTDGVLLVALTKEPEKRLGSEAEAKSWLDGVASSYASQAGISLGGGGGSGGGGAVGGGFVMNTEELDKMQAKQNDFVAQQVEVFLRYLGKDSRAGHQLADMQKAEVAALQEKLDNISKEHGDAYVQGIQPVFTPLKARHFNSSWNWVRQDALTMWMDILFGRLTTVDRDITARCLVIMNRADPALLDYMQYTIDNTPTEKGEKYALAKQFGQTLLDNCREMVGQPPLYKDVTFPTAPKTTVTAKGDIVVEEVNREGVSRLEKYVAEMAAGSKVTVQSVNLDKVQDQVEKLYKLVKSQPQISKTHMQSIKSLYAEVVRGLGKDVAVAPPKHKTAGRARRPSSQFLRPAAVPDATFLPEDKVPLLHLKRKIGNEWQYSSKLTSLYLDILKEIATAGVTFEHKNALMTGVGKGSIGIEIVKGLLAGGARVVITTSRYSRSTVEYYQAIYQECGSKGSSLTVVPFNQGSKQDVDALVDYIYSKDKGLGMDLDYILPFAALPENGREIDGLDDRSELAHRIMLTNVLRLLGSVKAKKAALKLTTRPTEVVLPLSPNHGLFGNDGLYSESKISLETLFNRWSSESWGEYLCIAGAVIGWTRGTGLMNATNSVAEGIEAQGCRTFSAKEMAFNILGLMHPLVFDVAQIEPVWADLNGGMDKLPDLANLTTDIRTKLNLTASTRRAIAKDNSADFKATHGPGAEQIHHQVKVAPRANFSLPFPELKPIDAKSEISKLRGLIDLEKVVVVTGYAEVGPFGSSRTRWEIEANGTFSIQGTLELAYIMGLIKHFEGRLKDGSLYVGWVDAKTNEPLDDKDVKAAYEKHILAHTGIRMIEPELFNGYDPKKKGFVQEIEIQHDLEAIEASEEDAERFKREHGDKVDVYSEDSKFFVKFKKGAKIQVPKAIVFDRVVAGQIPTGWSHKAFGIPDDIAAQVDRTSLWALVSVAEALMMAGITDPYELYKHVHPSEVGSSLGSGMGGIVSISKMFRDRREEKDVQKDILQETFINTVAGWVNLLLLSSSGPIKIPVGACATALQSVEIACDTILSGKAKVMIAGGYDDFSEEGSFEFANMKATSNSETEFAAGREPNEMSRPTTSTRAGFMESQGCGAQVLMSAKAAIEMGATIYGIVAYTATATDKAGRSIPAPGRGVMGTAREVASKFPSAILNVGYRRRQLEFRRKQISDWLENETEILKNEVESRGEADSSEYVAERLAAIESEAKRQESEALATYGMLVGSDANISPLRRALAVWGLTIDDVGVASFHGTSTVANDKNESNAYNEQFRHLGRAKGNACPVIAQKWLTGHPKGGAAAWMLNGMAQTILSGLIPGNRNADNISQELRAFEYLVYPSKSIQTDGIKAGLLTSFGFGQVGGQALIVHPSYLIGSLEPAQFESYKKLNAERKKLSYRKFNDFFTNGKLVVIKEGAQYEPENEIPVLLNPLARTESDGKGSFAMPKKLQQITANKTLTEAAANLAKQAASASSGTRGVGTDIELISAIPIDNENFLERNFTAEEQKYCFSAPNPQASFAGKWVGKEGTFKAMGVKSRGAGASLKDIEIVSTETGPTVVLHGDAKKAAEEKGITTFHLSISHTDDTAMAFVTAA
ncbi:hypothetical protein JCM8547_005957 [Rhodosporidiobolus lusitaniae]